MSTETRRIPSANFATTDKNMATVKKPESKTNSLGYVLEMKLPREYAEFEYREKSVLWKNSRRTVMWLLEIDTARYYSIPMEEVNLEVIRCRFLISQGPHMFEDCYCEWCAGTLETREQGSEPARKKPGSNWVAQRVLKEAIYKSDSYLNSKPKMNRTNATKEEKLFEEQDELRIIVEKLKEKIRNQSSIEVSCDESLIQPSASNKTDRTPLPPSPIKSSTSKECGEPPLLPVPVLAARFSKNSRVQKALLARNRRLQRHGITISVRLATATEKLLKYRCRKFSPLRWSQEYAESHVS
ncbi:uncharacterized protein Bfra_002592 [Botrytis fragariae]|uniref:Uncharacterized protein n=1 Tax=Botrytis fragariae TaxID=1964551 RepID=A0A8H6AZB1_9HELO|nr:uncharacterized protein Bfra_002592 [Botrytis fragariae]KAF5876190.1 hypothetical protein Bfra_002592 [Botrytis fragariae]